jgi:hypothetical protein
MNTVLHPTLAQKISSAINSRSVAAQMIDVVLKADPFVHADFLFWVNAHREASARLEAMGIECLTYTVEQSQ